MIEIVIIGLAVLVAFVCLMSLDLPTSASVDDRGSDHRPRSDDLLHVGLLRFVCAPILNESPRTLAVGD